MKTIPAIRTAHRAVPAVAPRLHPAEAVAVAVRLIVAVVAVVPFHPVAAVEAVAVAEVEDKT